MYLPIIASLVHLRGRDRLGTGLRGLSPHKMFFFLGEVSCSDGGSGVCDHRWILDVVGKGRLVHIPGSWKLGQCGFADSRSVEMGPKLLNDGGLREELVELVTRLSSIDRFSNGCNAR
jgi:hypothetical protein